MGNACPKGANCVASGSIGCIYCCQGCDAEKLRNAFTFLPPMASYGIDEEANERGKERRLTYLSAPIKSYSFYQQAAKHSEVHFVTTSRGERIPLVWVRRDPPGTPPQPGKPPPLVIIHCHGNATDIGMMMGPYFEMTKNLPVEVVGVEYSGYGAATGSPSANNTVADAEAAYHFVVSSGIPPERIVSYGQSVGSGPAVRLAARNHVGGVVLHSPMLSGIKVIDPVPDSCCRPSCVYFCFDFFPNDREMKTVNCPAFVIHGRQDDIIPLYHGLKLSEAAPKHFRWPGYFPRDANHNDIVERDQAAYFRELLNFLKAVEDRARAREALPQGIGKPSQIEMVSPIPQVAKDDNNDASPPGNEEPKAPVAVGPTDGRYENLRRGGGHAKVLTGGMKNGE